MDSMLETTQPAALENLARLRSFIADACAQTSIDPATCFALQLAVDEVCANIILHGYANLVPGAIYLAFQREQGQVKLTIVDQGCPFDPRQAPPPDIDAPWADRSIGGLGVYVVQTLIDEIYYQADSVQGNRLTLIKSLPGHL